MKKLFVCSDIHIGAIRTSGVTPASALALRQYILNSFEELLKLADGQDLLINGDLYDSNTVPLYDLLESYRILAEWLRRNPSSTLYNSRGNHCISKNSAQLSSWSFLGSLLAEEFRERSLAVDEPTMTPHGYIIPHLLNQLLFEDALTNVPECEVLFLHCNIDNEFAVNSDHSLNTTSVQIKKLPIKHSIVGHEHHQRKVSNILLPGNQIPASISDCLNTKAKYYAVVTDGVPELKQLNSIDNWYEELNWQNITATSAKFIRVTGTATPEQAVDVASRISELRRSSDAFVISNAVQIGSIDQEQAAQSLESVKAFDVMGALRQILDEDEMTILGGLK